MRRIAVTALGLAFLAPPAASAQVTQVQLAYDTYAAGIEVMQMQRILRSRPVELSHRSRLPYDRPRRPAVSRPPNEHRAGDMARRPGERRRSSSAKGVWRGHERRTLIGYDHGLPQVRELQPPQETEREPVPPELQRHTMDTLSALAQLMRRVEHDHTCETEVHTYDGRRVLDVVARHGRRRSGWTRPAAPSSADRRCAATSRAARSPASCSAKTTRSIASRCTAPPGWHRCCPTPRRFRCASVPDPLVRRGDDVPDQRRPLARPCRFYRGRTRLTLSAVISSISARVILTAPD